MQKYWLKKWSYCNIRNMVHCPHWRLLDGGTWGMWEEILSTPGWAGLSGSSGWPGRPRWPRWPGWPRWPEWRGWPNHRGEGNEPVFPHNISRDRRIIGFANLKIRKIRRFDRIFESNLKILNEPNQITNRILKSKISRIESRIES